MKVLLINKFHYMRGGSETYYFALAEALKEKGCEVVFFAMDDEKNIECAQSKYFVPNIDYNAESGLKSKISAVKNFVYSKSAAEQIEKLIKDEKPDIAHIGLLHRQITFSVVDVLRRYNIPIVMSVHDLIFACPNYTMLSRGQTCEKCINGSVFSCIKDKCVKNSLSKSILAAYEKTYLVRKGYYNKIDLYITECEFYADLMRKSGVTKSRIITMTNFLPVSQVYGFSKDYEDYILYFGRFSREKGLMTLLKTHEKLGCRYKLKIVGNGPIKDEMFSYISSHGLANIDMPGAIYGDDMESIIEKARVVVVPSEWYENCPYALLQAIAKGKIVIASRIGGLPELILDENTGYLFSAGDYKDLAEKIETVMTMRKVDYEKMSVETAEAAEKSHGWKNYTDKLIGEYNDLLKVKEK